jgi:hypothetical protein
LALGSSLILFLAHFLENKCRIGGTRLTLVQGAETEKKEKRKEQRGKRKEERAKSKE